MCVYIYIYIHTLSLSLYIYIYRPFFRGVALAQGQDRFAPLRGLLLTYNILLCIISWYAIVYYSSILYSIMCIYIYIYITY